MQVNSLTNEQLDHYAAKALGWKIVMWGDKPVWAQSDVEGRFRCNVADWKPSTDWSQGGLIIDREGIGLEAMTDWREDGNYGQIWEAHAISWGFICADTPLIAAMRCFAASKFGDEVEES